MNNKHLSWYKEINNNFIIASRAYFLHVLLYSSRLRFFVGKLLSKWEGPYVIEEVYRSGAVKINNFEGTSSRVVNSQRIKHYISGNPINVETNIIETVTPEEYIRDTFQNVPDSEKE